MTKVKMTDELMDRMNTVFDEHPMILTNQGLSRTELRFLERKNYIEMAYKKDKNGTLRCMWMRPSIFEGLKVPESKASKELD